jgi:predicted RNA-binding Zn-ribbon protein involved in translation (DUF1610 family)
MSEETTASSMDNSQHEGISKVAAKDVEELPFRCPSCGGQQLSYGVKSYLKAVIYADGEMVYFGGDSFGEDDVDFACWDCGHIISDNGEPIRRAADMAEWLMANCEQAPESKENAASGNTE